MMKRLFSLALGISGLAGAAFADATVDAPAPAFQGQTSSGQTISLGPVYKVIDARIDP